MTFSGPILYSIVSSNCSTPAITPTPLRGIASTVQCRRSRPMRGRASAPSGVVAAARGARSTGLASVSRYRCAWSRAPPADAPDRDYSSQACARHHLRGDVVGCDAVNYLASTQDVKAPVHRGGSALRRGTAAAARADEPPADLGSWPAFRVPRAQPADPAAGG